MQVENDNIFLSCSSSFIDYNAAFMSFAMSVLCNERHYDDSQTRVHSRQEETTKENLHVIELEI